MDFEKVIVNILTSVVLVFRNFLLLIFSPYRAMRNISQEKDYSQVFIIFLTIFLYFKFVYFLRDKPYPATLTFAVFILHFLTVTVFFYSLGRISDDKLKFSSFIFTLSYSLFPTIIWFASNSLLYVFIPPPRSYTLLGKGFSIFFIAYSVSLLSWKIILMYLALRFSTRTGFYRILFMLLLFLVWTVPFSVLLFYLRIFRIPFI